MKKLFATSFAAAFMAGSAAAADLGYINQPAPQAFTSHVSAMDWTGFYAGLNAGYGWAAVEVGGVTFDDGRGLFGGAQIGYNHDFGGFVLGAEADFQISDISYEQTPLPGVTARTALDNFGTVRARAGLAIDRFLPYVTGGFAWGNASVSVSGGGGANLSLNDTYAGWTVGAGAEYAILDNLSVKGEYLYTDFGAADFGTGVDLNLTSHVVRAGVNFHF
jgi:outer membrane immunogenic protein